MTVFFIHSVVGGEINDKSHVQWLLSRVRSFCLWRSNTRQFPADMTTLVFSAKKSLLISLPIRIIKELYRMQEIALGHEVTP